MAAPDGKIVCEIDGARCHSIKIHLSKFHPTWTLEAYEAKYPHAPTLSAAAKAALKEKIAVKKIEREIAEGTRAPMHELFGLGEVQGARNKKGDPIMVSVGDYTAADALELVPTDDPNYVFNIDILKSVLIGIELNDPIYLWGYHGTGKTTMFEQVCARTKRPFMRVQHTVNTEESHIVGQWTVRDGETHFIYGPLADAMMNGYIYCADEYDYAMPSVLSVYQPVLEGKPLFIKEAPIAQRVVKPHPNFRICATGNTNGGGDETGLYQGTQIQNAANYSRFGITEQVNYMDEKTEVMVVSGQSGVKKEYAEQLVKLANMIREQYKAGRLSATPGPRELIKAARNGMVRGGEWRKGFEVSFSNRLSSVDKQAVDQLAQRVFG